MAAHVDTTAIPVRLDIVLQRTFGVLGAKELNWLLRHIVHTVQWCARQQETHQVLPLFDLDGTFPRLWICERCVYGYEVMELSLIHI